MQHYILLCNILLHLSMREKGSTFTMMQSHEIRTGLLSVPYLLQDDCD